MTTIRKDPATVAEKPSSVTRGGGIARERSRIDFGTPTGVLRGPSFSFRVPMRVVLVSLALLVLALLCAILALTLGDFPLTLDQVASALVGGGEKFHRMIVLEWRLPVVIAAVVFGALLGIGGAIFQSITRNPLGSPDVIGFDAGSYTAVVITVLVLQASSTWSLAAASLIGGLATAFAVYVLAYRRGLQGFRLIIVGIGVSAVLGSINAYLITRADIEDAISVGFWGAGSISRVTWAGLAPALVLALVVFVAAALLSAGMRSLELGDDASVGHGTRVNAIRLSLVVVGVSTTALVTAAAGPIGFIALVAPQLARRVTGSAGVSLLSAGTMGALLLAFAHLLSLVIAQFYRPIPVGLLTVCVGGVYLIWLLIHEARRQSGVNR